jgi:hypothetical protein
VNAVPATALPERDVAIAPPVETIPAAPAPIAEQPAVTPELQQVGSIPTSTEVAETRSDLPAVAADTAEVQEPAKAKRKRVARKAKAKPKRPAPRAPAATVDAFGNPVNATTSTANRPAQGFWGPFN